MSPTVVERRHGAEVAEPGRPAAGVGGDAAASTSAVPDLERLADWFRPLGNRTRLRLLSFLTTPHYLEEVGSHLRLTRQAARKHLDKLVKIGVLTRQSGVRESGPVTEYVLNPQFLFVMYDEVEKLGSLRPEERKDVLMRTMTGTGRAGVAGAPLLPTLTVVRGLNVGQRFPVARGPARAWTVGRDARCDLALGHDPYASNRHAEVRHDVGRFRLVDLASTNGTYHNWTRLTRGGDVPLRHGDVVGVGRTILLFWDPSTLPPA